MSHDDEDSDSYKMSLRGIPLAMSMQSLNHGGKGYVGSDLFEASSLSKSYHRAAVANESSGVDTGGAWTEERDLETGMTYYHHSSTLKSRWERPADMPVEIQLEASQPSPVVNSTSPRPERNSLTEAADWTRTFAAVNSAKKAWLALVDSSSGSTYYFNETTGETQWNKPIEDAVGNLPRYSRKKTLGAQGTIIDEENETSAGAVQMPAGTLTRNDADASAHEVATAADSRGISGTSGKLQDPVPSFDGEVWRTADLAADTQSLERLRPPGEVGEEAYARLSQENIPASTRNTTTSESTMVYGAAFDSCDHDNDPEASRPASARKSRETPDDCSREELRQPLKLRLSSPRTAFAAWGTPLREEKNDAFQTVAHTEKQLPSSNNFESQKDYGSIDQSDARRCASEVPVNSQREATKVDDSKGSKEHGVGAEEEANATDRDDNCDTDEGGLDTRNATHSGRGVIGDDAFAHDSAVLTSVSTSYWRENSDIGLNVLPSSPLAPHLHVENFSHREGHDGSAIKLRAHSSSTLSTSTYSAGLESLAKHVKYHSSTLKRGATDVKATALTEREATEALHVNGNDEEKHPWGEPLDEDDSACGHMRDTKEGSTSLSLGREENQDVWDRSSTAIRRSARAVVHKVTSSSLTLPVDNGTESRAILAVHPRLHEEEPKALVSTIGHTGERVPSNTTHGNVREGRHLVTPSPSEKADAETTYTQQAQNTSFTNTCASHARGTDQSWPVLEGVWEVADSTSKSNGGLSSISTTGRFEVEETASRSTSDTHEEEGTGAVHRCDSENKVGGGRHGGTTPRVLTQGVEKNKDRATLARFAAEQNDGRSVGRHIVSDGEVIDKAVAKPSHGEPQMEAFETNMVDRPTRSLHDDKACEASQSVGGISPTSLALKRLQDGLQSRRRTAASVRIQAQVRRWVARNRFDSLSERRATRLREEHEAKHRAATAIQAVVRGQGVRVECAARTKWSKDNQEGSPDENCCREGHNTHSCDIPGGDFLQSTLRNSVGKVCTLPVEALPGHLQWGNIAMPATSERDSEINLQGEQNSLHNEIRVVNSSISSNDLHIAERGFEMLDDERVWDGRRAAGAPTCGSSLRNSSEEILQCRYQGTAGDSNVGEVDHHSANEVCVGPLFIRLGTIEEEDTQPQKDESRMVSVAKPIGLTSPHDTMDLDDGFRGVESSSGRCSFEARLVNDPHVGEEEPEDGKWGAQYHPRSDSGGETEISSDLTEPRGSASLSDESSYRSTSQTSSGDQRESPSLPSEAGSVDVMHEVKRIRVCRSSRDRITSLADSIDDRAHESDEASILNFGSTTIPAMNGQGFWETTVPMKTLKELRALVAKQAEAAARMAMAVAGTDDFKRTALRIRELASRQKQKARNFQNMIRTSITMDSEVSSGVLTPMCLDNVNEGISQRVHPDLGNLTLLEGSALMRTERAQCIANETRATSTQLHVVDIVNDGRYDNQSHQRLECFERADGTDRRRQAYQDAENWADESVIARRDTPVADVSHKQSCDDEEGGVGHREAAADMFAEQTNTMMAASALTLEFTRLASRQDEAASQLHGVRSTRGKGPYLNGGLEAQQATTVLGHSVALQARAVGLLEEVVTRTVQSRVVAQIIVRAARKREVGILAKSLGDDAKLIAARYQHAATRMEAAPDRKSARLVAEGMRQLTLVQERVAYKVQHFVSSANFADFTKPEGEMSSESEDGIPAVECAEWTVPKADNAEKVFQGFATTLVQELRKGVIFGDVAATRAEAIRSGGQAVRLADELRSIASSQVAAGTNLAEWGTQFSRDALAEIHGQKMPRSRDIALVPAVKKARPVSAWQEGGGEKTTTTMIIDDVQERKLSGELLQEEADQGTGKQQERSAVVSRASDTTAIQIAAEKEKIFAAERMTLRLPCWREDNMVNVSVADEVVGQATGETADFFQVESVPGRIGRDCWLSAAVRLLKQTVDLLLFGEVGADGHVDQATAAAPTPMLSRSACDAELAIDGAIKGVCNDMQKSGTRKAIDPRQSDTELATSDETHGSSDDDDSNNSDDDSAHQVFPPLPLRARALSLYTFSPPGDERNLRPFASAHYDAGDRVRGITRLEKLDPDVAARLSASRSVFALRAADVLFAFPPSQAPRPPPASVLAAAVSHSRPSTAPRAFRHHISRAIRRVAMPSDALHHHLTTAVSSAKPASFRPRSTGGSGLCCQVPGRAARVVRREPRQSQWPALPGTRKSHTSRYKTCEADASWGNRSVGDKMGTEDGQGGQRKVQEAEPKRRASQFPAPSTALGRRLRNNRAQMICVARRKRAVGKTDAFRVRHAIKQHCVGAVESALIVVGRTLDARATIRREQREVLPEHMEDLLQLMDRFVLSGSQLDGPRHQSSGKARDTGTSDGVHHTRNRCEICTALLDDLHRHFSAVCERPSWEYDANPFCCDYACGNPYPMPTPPFYLGERRATDIGVKTPSTMRDCCNEHTVRADDVVVEDRDEESLACPHHDRTPIMSGIRGSAPSKVPAMDPRTGLTRVDPRHVVKERQDGDNIASHQCARARTGMPANDEDTQVYSHADAKTLVRVNTPLSNGSGTWSLPGDDRPTASVRRFTPTAAGQEQVRLTKVTRGMRARPPRKPEAVAAGFSAHLHGIDKYPWDFARLCRFAQFLVENSLLREAYEVILHAIASSTVTTSITCEKVIAGAGKSKRENTSKDRRYGATAPYHLSPIPPSLSGHLSLTAGRLALALGRYSDSVWHVNAAARTVTLHVPHNSAAIYVASSRVFDFLLDHRSAEVLLLACLARHPDYRPALSSYGRLAARVGELEVAERYLRRAISLSCIATTSGTQHGEKGQLSSDWIALLGVMSDKQWGNVKAANTAACFRKALGCMGWKAQEAGADAGSLPPSSSTSIDITIAVTNTAADPVAANSSVSTPHRPAVSLAAEGDLKPDSADFMELGRFELLQNRSAEKASAFFGACLKEYPWHASAKVHLAYCLMEQLGPCKRGRAPPRSTASRTDHLLRSVLNSHVRGQTFPCCLKVSQGAASVANSSFNSERQQTQQSPGKDVPCRSIESHRGLSWLLWAFYARFAEDCLNNPRLALYALDQAVDCWSTGRRRGGNVDMDAHTGWKREDLASAPLVARAQFYQRWPRLLVGGSGACNGEGGWCGPRGEGVGVASGDDDGDSGSDVDHGVRGGGGSCGNGNGVAAPELERLFVDATERCPDDPAGHAALGYFLLSNDYGEPSLAADTLRRAEVAFENATRIPTFSQYVPALRGLAIVSRRLVLGSLGGRRGIGNNLGDAEGSREKERNGAQDESHLHLIMRALEVPHPLGRENIALLRTAAMHLFCWRATAVVSPTACRGDGEKQAEKLLSKAVELEPFHVPTLVTLAMVLFQRGSEGAVDRAGKLLENAVKYSGRTAHGTVTTDAVRALAHLRAAQGRRKAAASLFRRAAAIASHLDTRDGYCRSAVDVEPLSLLGLAQLLASPRRHNPSSEVVAPCPDPVAGTGVADADPVLVTCSGTIPGHNHRRDLAGEAPHVPAAALTIPSAALSTLPTIQSAIQSAPSAMEASKTLPSKGGKEEAARLFLRALIAAGGTAPPEHLRSGVDEGLEEIAGTNDILSDKSGGVDNPTATNGHHNGVLAVVHLAMSGYTLSIQRKPVAGVQIKPEATRHGAVARDGSWGQWHLRQAAKACSHSKAGLLARYFLGKAALSRGDDRRAEILLLEAVDAEPTTYGACAALLSVLRQIPLDVAESKARLYRLRRRGRRRKGRRGAGGVTIEKPGATHVGHRLDVERRSLKLLEQLEFYASLRESFAGDRLSGPGLANLEWAMILDEGWEAQYTRILEASDGWAALYRSR